MTAAARLTTELDSARSEIAREYFRRIEYRHASPLDLVSDDITLYFPKFGEASGKAGMKQFAQALGRTVTSLGYDHDQFLIHVAGDYVIVEGHEHGLTSDGTSFPDGTTSAGRFCNVFKFDGLLITSLHIYTDPDFTSSHTDRVRQLARAAASGETAVRTKA
jgi:hypothetical protein